MHRAGTEAKNVTIARAGLALFVRLRTPGRARALPTHSTKMNKLSVSEIGGMLEKQGMGQYALDFRRRKVDGAELCKMEVGNLIKLGVMNPAHQTFLLQRIELYREDRKSSGSKGSPWSTPVFGFLRNAKAKVLEAASQCIASTQKGVAGCTVSVGKITSGVGGGDGGSDSGVKTKVLEAVSHCLETTEEAFTACTESVIDAKQALHEKFTGEPAGGSGGALAASLAMPRGRRTVVMAPSITIPQGWKPPVHKKSATAEGFLTQALATNKLFKTLAPSDCEVMLVPPLTLAPTLTLTLTLTTTLAPTLGLGLGLGLGLAPAPAPTPTPTPTLALATARC